jgi:hypothetical protein
MLATLLLAVLIALLCLAESIHHHTNMPAR